MRKPISLLVVGLSLLVTACADPTTEATHSTATGDTFMESPSEELPTASQKSGIPDPEAGNWILIDENQMVEDMRPTEEESSEVPPDDDTTDASVPRKVPIEPPPSTTTPPAVGDVPDALLQAVITDAASRAGVAEAGVSVIRAQAVVWNDGSLGCPSPSQMYTQALVNGYWIVVGIGDREYDYRASLEGYFKLCVGGGGDPHAVDR